MFIVSAAAAGCTCNQKCFLSIIFEQLFFEFFQLMLAWKSLLIVWKSLVRFSCVGIGILKILPTINNPTDKFFCTTIRWKNWRIKAHFFQWIIISVQTGHDQKKILENESDWMGEHSVSNSSFPILGQVATASKVFKVKSFPTDLCWVTCYWKHHQ